MVSCFFCQNLLSDFIEGILPNSRQLEVRSHLESCRECAELRQNITDTIGLLKKLPSLTPNSELTQRALSASRSGYRSWASPTVVSRWSLGLLAPCLIIIAFFSLYPHLFPWRNLISDSDDETQFVRFFPLMHGASEIVDEQTSWLHERGLESGSLWEEGGLSPDEFERSFETGHSRNPSP